MRVATSFPRIYADQRGLPHILIELKTGRDIDAAWEKQLLNYLRATEVEVGLLFHFGPQAQFRRYAFENTRKNPRNPRESAVKKLPESCR